VFMQCVMTNIFIVNYNACDHKIYVICYLFGFNKNIHENSCLLKQSNIKKENYESNYMDKCTPGSV
jgi:hypothetical protein